MDVRPFQKLTNLRSDLVFGSLQHAGDAPIGQELLVTIDSENGVGIADIDGQEKGFRTFCQARRLRRTA